MGSLDPHLQHLVIARIDGLLRGRHGFPTSQLTLVDQLPTEAKVAPIGWGEYALRDALLHHPKVLERVFGATGTSFLAAELHKVDLTAVHQHDNGKAITR